MIPESVNICGHEYAVQQVKPKGGWSYGYGRPADQLILIDKSDHPQRQASTIVHESIECRMVTQGWDAILDKKMGHTLYHQMVNDLENFMFQFTKDNEVASWAK